MPSNGLQSGEGDAPAFPESDPVALGADSEELARYARRRGNLLVGSSTQRAAYAYPRAGEVWSNTTTGTLDYYTGSSWVTGVLPVAPHFRVTRDSAAFNFTNSWTNLQWDATLMEGTLAGFSTSDRTTYTCTVAGVYLFGAQVTSVGASSQSIQIRVYRNGAPKLFSLAGTIASAFSSVQTNGTVRFDVGDTMSVAIFSSSTVAGVPGAATYCSVDYLHA